MGISVHDVESVAMPVAQSAGVDVEAVNVETIGRREKLTVVVDADGGVDLDAIAELSTALSAALDAHEAIADSPYVLEVTSPGVDRPLTLPRHWRRAKDRLVAIERTDGTSVTGRVTSSDDSEGVLDVNGSAISVPYTDVVRAVVQVEFDRKDS